MKKENLELILELARSTLNSKNPISFNELRRSNRQIVATADAFSAALLEHAKILPKDIRFTASHGVVDPSVVKDLVIEKV